MTMTPWFTVLLAVLTMNAPFAYAVNPSLQIMTAIEGDVSVSGPGDKVLLYYKDGNDIVVRNCKEGYASSVRCVGR